ncbi:unnamed protein product [Paramecium octaurelia]|uniref:Uncharacterized protein n=1 Tax=Paramecium octaurelia TaxID=43137 RepID=A0A8S1WAD0_PAROT|nr:unnamed protein product [Paramecium octaurelia]
MVDFGNQIKYKLSVQKVVLTQIVDIKHHLLLVQIQRLTDIEMMEVEETDILAMMREDFQFNQEGKRISFRIQEVMILKQDVIPVTVLLCYNHFQGHNQLQKDFITQNKQRIHISRLENQLVYTIKNDYLYNSEQQLNKDVSINENNQIQFLKYLLQLSNTRMAIKGQKFRGRNRRIIKGCVQAE